jgi:hypothetical protein
MPQAPRIGRERISIITSCPAVIAVHALVVAGFTQYTDDIVSIVSVAFLALRHAADHDDIVGEFRKERDGIQKSTDVPLGASSAVKHAFSLDQSRTSFIHPSSSKMIRAIFLHSLTVGLAFGKQLEPGQWHPAVESDGTFKQKQQT